MSPNIDSLLRNSDPLISDALDRALSEKEISVKEATRLYEASGTDFHLVGLYGDRKSVV